MTVWLKKEARRAHGLFFAINTICKCRLWLLYVNDPLRLSLINVLHYGAAIVYQSFKYGWMPEYTYEVAIHD